MPKQVKRYLKVIDVQVTHCGQCPAAQRIVEDRDVKQPIYCFHEKTSGTLRTVAVGWWRTNGYDAPEDRRTIPSWCPLPNVNGD